MSWTLVKDKITGHVYDVAVVVPERHEVRKTQPPEGAPRPVRTKYAAPRKKTSPTSRSGAAREATNQKANEAKEEKS